MRARPKPAVAESTLYFRAIEAARYLVRVRTRARVWARVRLGARVRLRVRVRDEAARYLYRHTGIIDLVCRYGCRLSGLMMYSSVPA